MDVPDSDHSGHRARVRERLLKTGGDGLLDYELLEYLLAVARPRIDTKPIAKALLREFDTLPGVLSADPLELARVPQVGESSIAAIKIVHAAAIRMAQVQARERPVLANWQALLDYLRADMAHHKTERIRVLHLDTRNKLIRDEVVSEGSIDQATLHIREVIKRAIDLGSAAIILVHNHPTGDPSPSRADIDLTRSVIEAGKRLGIAVHDHIVIGTQGHASLRSMGLM